MSVSRILMAVVGATLCGGLANAQSAGNEAATYKSMIDQYCVDCHDPIENRGGLSLDDVDFTKVSQHAGVFEKVITKMRGASMPPVGKARPDPATYDKFASWLETELDKTAAAKPNPGRPALYRLNREEYKNVVRDMLALNVDVKSLMAPDNSSYGFDNVADVLNISPALLEGYLSAADRISAMAIGDPDLPREDSIYRVNQRLSQNEHIEGLPLGSRGGLATEHYFPLDGTYEISTTFLKNTLSVIRGLEFPHQFEISVDGKQVKLITMGGTSDYSRLLENADEVRAAVEERARVRVPLTAGTHRIVVTFLQKTGAIEVDQLQPFESINFDPVYIGGIPSVEGVLIRGPFDAKAPSVETPSRRAIFSCRPKSARDEAKCADQILGKIARTAYRRPVNEADMKILRDFYAQGRQTKGTFDGGIQMGLRRVLSSPDFIFRMERDPQGLAAGTPFRISDLELASRLSFFLWSSAPDAELLDVAAKGKLSDNKVLEQQVRRMLADPRSESIATNFAAQWLRLRNLDSQQPDSYSFPNFDEGLREAFRTETLMFFDSVMRDDRSVVDLLTADYTFMNERLARHYGVKGVYGSDFRRVKLDDVARRGLLGQGTFLMVTALPTRTSPVKRGAWVLENLLANPPPTPPDNVPALKENAIDTLDREPLRVRLERHRADPGCAACHNIMDPIGFSLEVFDGIGTKRAKDEGGLPIDSSGSLASGQQIQGVNELRDVIAKNPERYMSAFTEKLLTYALGRGLEYYDMPVVRNIVNTAEHDNFRFSTVVMEVVKSMPFQMKMSAGQSELSASASQPAKPAQ